MRKLKEPAFKKLHHLVWTIFAKSYCQLQFWVHFDLFLIKINLFSIKNFEICSTFDLFSIKVWLNQIHQSDFWYFLTIFKHFWVNRKFYWLFLINFWTFWLINRFHCNNVDSYKNSDWNFDKNLKFISKSIQSLKLNLNLNLFFGWRYLAQLVGKWKNSKNENWGC